MVVSGGYGTKDYETQTYYEVDLRKLPLPARSRDTPLAPEGRGFHVDSRHSLRRNRRWRGAIQRPTIYTQVYCCVYAPRRGRGRSLCIRWRVYRSPTFFAPL